MSKPIRQSPPAKNSPHSERRPEVEKGTRMNGPVRSSAKRSDQKAATGGVTVTRRVRHRASTIKL